MSRQRGQGVDGHHHGELGGRSAAPHDAHLRPITLADRVEGYIALRRSLGYAFHKQAAILRALPRYVAAEELDGPLTRDMALGFVFSWEGTANGRAIRHGVLRRFCDYLAIYDARTEALDPRALSRSRAIPPPRILSDAELGSLMSA